MAAVVGGRAAGEQSAWSRAAAAQIKAERAAQDLTQRDLAAASGVPYGTLRRIEACERVVDISQLARIAHALDVPLDEFMRRVSGRIG